MQLAGQRPAERTRTPKPFTGIPERYPWIRYISIFLEVINIREVKSQEHDNRVPTQTMYQELEFENKFDDVLYKAELEMVSRDMQEEEIDAYKYYMVDFLNFVDGCLDLTETDIQNYIEGQLEEGDPELAKKSLRLLFREILRS